MKVLFSCGFVRVVPELWLDKQFDYEIPENLRGKIFLGHRLKVPWGTRTMTAFAVGFPEKPEVEKCKAVLEVSSEHPMIPPTLMKLAEWVADYYCCDLSAAIKNVLPAPVRSEQGHKMQIWVSIPAHLSETHVAQTLGKKAKAQMRVWQYASQHNGGWLADLCLQTRTTHAVWRALADRGFVIFNKEKIDRNPLASEISLSAPLELMLDQQKALKMILDEARKPAPLPILLQGVTGSGKTEVYLQALSQILAEGKNALVLVPEIALTSQTIEHFRARFEGKKIRVATLHSHLSDGERHDQWHQIRAGTARVVIGARSAVFAPVQNLGLIVVDEEHEPSYKQEETPFYHARDVAVMRGKLENIPVILGSATPSLESVYNAQQKKYRLIHLPRRIDEKELPVIHLVDLRKEKKKGAVTLSETLTNAIAQRIERGEQCILFLNRRGFATMVQCPNCGHTEECPHCSVALTYHRVSRALKCHWCNYARAVPKKCPECEFEAYHYSGMGTQKIEDAVQSIFPNIRWHRMDSDSMRGKFAYEKVFGAFREGKIDLLVGTQMIAKGLHFPNVTCVGVIHVDAALHLPDFRAAERVFQQLVQVAGRSGRGETRGEVFIQTHTPFHPAIQFARHHDVDGFQDQEMEFRRKHDYPPFARIALMTLRSKSESKARFCAEELAKRICKALPAQTEMTDPQPAPIAKIQDFHRLQIFIKTHNMLAISRLLKKEIPKFTLPSDVKMTINIDPINLL
ncbi:MAG: replication restart helicase PriA [Verrucomicrobiota bacterium]